MAARGDAHTATPEQRARLWAALQEFPLDEDLGAVELCLAGPRCSARTWPPSPFLGSAALRYAGRLTGRWRSRWSSPAATGRSSRPRQSSSTALTVRRSRSSTPPRWIASRSSARARRARARAVDATIDAGSRRSTSACR